MLTEKDIEQIKSRGSTPEKVLCEIEAFKKGFPFAKLDRPCTVGNGITVIDRDELERLAKVYTDAALSGRAMKFVPASGSASRMFKSLLSVNARYESIDRSQIVREAEKGDSDSKALLEFIDGIEKFAFYDDLKSALKKKGLNIEALLSKGDFKDILDCLLADKGLGYADIPKGLLKFHRYPDCCRTPFEEHLVEAAEYVRDKDGIARVHFTVPSEYEERIGDFIDEVRDHYESSGVKCEVTFSVQNPATDTIAVDLENKPFRDENGNLVFRPGGHGALLENLSDLKGDIVFIKNIDNVVPDRLKHETYVYKKALGGFLIELQEEISGRLRQLTGRDLSDEALDEIIEFAGENLSVVVPVNIEQGAKKDKIKFLFSMLNRPLRVCGMVKNEGEPGGGPFWVRGESGNMSAQIVESSQVDMKSKSQRAVWESSTHFNPVDLVCGVRDYAGNNFDLTKFTDPNTGFISVKSKDGKELKALELPGLWNGGMANWNTIFVEVPIATFSPVKTVLDLLHDEHQPG